MKKILYLLFLLVGSFNASSQEIQSGGDLSPALSKAFEHPDPAIEMARLLDKREKLVLRLKEIQTKPNEYAAEIARIHELIGYIDSKVEALQKYINSVNYAESNNLPAKGNLSEEEYRQQKLEWQKKHASDNIADPTKTTLTRDEFNKLPKERQERILSMPERYTIVD